MGCKNRRRLQWSALLLSALLFMMSLIPTPVEAAARGQLTVYFPNWNIYSSESGQVKRLPWAKIDCVNHAFWKIVPEGDGFAIASTDPWADTDPNNPRAHFPQYEEYWKKYPQANILLSIGGWNCSGYFSLMASTAAGRASFIGSCVETLQQYPFLTGLDIDWEYPGAARKGSGKDQGNPVQGDDRTNYTLLLKELRLGLDEVFGKGKKQLTVCASASTAILEKQDYAALFPYVNRIHLMTYDMAGSGDGKTGHHSALYGEGSVDTAVKYLLREGVPAAKIAIGTPLYSHGWKMNAGSGTPVGAAARGLSNGVKLWKDLKKLEISAVPVGVPGWHAGYDETSQAAYLWNDDPASGNYNVFYSYENERSLDAKLQYIYTHSLGGLIVWQAGGDDAEDGWPMITRMHDALRR